MDRTRSRSRGTTDSQRGLRSAVSRWTCRSTDGEERAVSPAVGTLLVIGLTLLMVSAATASLVVFDDSLDDRLSDFNDLDAVLNDDTPWIGSPSGLVQQSNNEAGATDVRYRIQYFHDPAEGATAESLKKVKLQVTTGSPDMFSNTSEAKLEYVIIDEDGDGKPERFLTSDVNGWEAGDGGTEMDIAFTGSYTIQPGETITIVFGGVDNPTTPGVYQLEAKTNAASNWKTGTITII